MVIAAVLAGMALSQSGATYSHVAVSASECRIRSGQCDVGDGVTVGPRNTCELRCFVDVPHSLVQDVSWTAGLVYFNGGSGGACEPFIEVTWSIVDVTSGERTLTLGPFISVPGFNPLFVMEPSSGIELADTETLVGDVTLAGGDVASLSFFGYRFFFEADPS